MSAALSVVCMYINIYVQTPELPLNDKIVLGPEDSLTTLKMHQKDTY